MSTLAVDSLIAHMQAQLASLRSMAEILTRQEEAVRANKGEEVLQTISQLQGELQERVRLEQERDLLIKQWAGELGCASGEVTAGRIAALDPARATQVRELSDQLHREALEVQAQQQYCRGLLQSELRFISHLVEALYPGRQTGAYQPGDVTTKPAQALTVDIKG